MKKIALITYNSELMCFAHVLLYALDFHEKGWNARIVIEGGAVQLISAFKEPEAPFASLYEQVKGKGLIDCVCKACSAKFGTAAEAEAQGLTLAGELMGHPSLERYIEEGYQIITF